MAFDRSREAQLSVPSPAAASDGPWRHVIRRADANDLAGFMELARLAGPGFTSLPTDEEKLLAVLEGGAAAAAGAPGPIMLALEDVETGAVAGCAAVKRGGRPRPGFANFRLLRDGSGTPRQIVMTTEYDDLTEVGALFVRPDFRSKGVGRWLAQSRYLYLATDPASFGETVYAELRGVIHEDGTSPFFEAVGRQWLQMSFKEADRICSIGDNEKLVARMPDEPISLDNFPAEALASMGACHPSGAAARAMLEREGFAFDDVIDLLDGGALLRVKTTDLATIRHSRLARVKCADVAEGEMALLASPDAANFRCVGARAAFIDDAVFCDRRTCEALRVQDGDLLRVLP